LATAIAFFVAGLYFSQQTPRIARCIALAAWCACGALSVQLRGETPVPNIDRFLDGREITVTAYVVAEGNVQQAGFGGLQQSIDVITERVASDVESVNVSFGLRLHVYGKGPNGADPAGRMQRMRVFRYGERLRFPAKLRWPRNYRNDGAFDYVTYLADRQIVAQGSTKYEDVEILSGVAGTAAARWRANIHRSIVEKVHVLWPPRQAVLMDAMVIGDDAFIHRDARADFQRSGTYHILVVSGMNVGILAFVLFWVLRRLRASEIVATCIVVLFSIAYAFLTDVGPPIWRATLMMALYLGVRLLYRDRSMLNAIGGAALCLLILDPKALLGASFH
jgi:competence protein ComEC